VGGAAAGEFTATAVGLVHDVFDEWRDWSEQFCSDSPRSVRVQHLFASNRRNAQ
jgi:hypothetical protein